MKDVMEINNGGKFHIYSIYGCEVIHYCEVEVIQMFFAMEYLEEGGGGVWALTLSNIVRFC